MSKTMGGCKGCSSFESCWNQELDEIVRKTVQRRGEHVPDAVDLSVKFFYHGSFTIATIHVNGQGVNEEYAGASKFMLGDTHNVHKGNMIALNRACDGFVEKLREDRTIREQEEENSFWESAMDKEQEDGIFGTDDNDPSRGMYDLDNGEKSSKDNAPEQAAKDTLEDWPF